MGRGGPGVSFFGLHKQPFALITNETSKDVDLVIFNWPFDIVKNFETHQKLSRLLNRKIYILKGINKKSIATQGESNDLLTNFSYINGSNYMARQLTVLHPNITVPEEYKMWQPHPNFMNHDHPLRMTLDGHTLALLHPSKEKYSGPYTQNPATKALLFKKLEESGGYLRVILGMMVHESFHIQEANDSAYNKTSRRKIDVDREKLIRQLKENKLQQLIKAYTSTVFSISDSLPHSNSSIDLLKDLNSVINTLKKEYPDAWKFIWNFEYTEGFAEYTAAQSMIEIGVVSLPREIKLLQSNPSNNIAYRTGALGGLYLYYYNKDLPLSNGEDTRMSVWELIIAESNIANGSEAPNINEILARTSNSSLDLDDEMERIVEYLTGTLTEF